jgi:uncharacterized membrane protein
MHDETLLAERTIGLQLSLAQMQSDFTAFSEKLEKQYVTTKEFWPVKALVYGAVGSVLTAIVGSILMLVLREMAP